MKYYKSIFLALLFIIFSCNSEEESHEVDTFPAYETDPDIELTDSKHLIIEGQDIWVRDKPVNGDIVMKLNTGDTCKILEITDEIDQIRDMFDIWYKIEFNNKIGWVFGAQTDKKSREIHDIIPFETYFEEIALKYDGNTEDMFFYEHKEIPFILLYNIGLYCTEYSTEGEIGELPEDLNDDNIYNKKPKGDVCEGFPGVESGFYYWKIKIKDLPSYPDMSDEEFRYKKINIPEKYTNNTFIKVQIITEEYHFSYLYFINIEETWYLIVEDRCDCSA